MDPIRLTNAENLISKIKNSDFEELKKLTTDIRSFIISTVSKNGGHLASNLGTVDLTVALYKSFDFPEKDVLVWDTGHQTYTHKIITGRADRFDTLRTKNGISGFTNIFESDFDSFGAGHVGTSIGAALAFEQAKRLRGEKGNIVAVIGDGALTSGNALEALNQASNLKSNIRIIINDNGMSISPNVGSLASNFALMRTSHSYTALKNNLKSFFQDTHLNVIEKSLKLIRNGLKNTLIPHNIFEGMGFKYLGPIDGHDIELMSQVFNNLKNDYDKPVIIHVQTKKGKGLECAERQPTRFHGIGKMPMESFVCEEIITARNSISYSEALGFVLTELGRRDEKLIAVTAAMEHGTGLFEFRRHFPERFFDLGITEQFCATFAAGMAKKGFHPVYAVYSTFSQRAYDQFIHDIALQELPVLICLDRAGLVGSDGPTHHGNFDINFAVSIPNARIYSPSNIREFTGILNYIVNENWCFNGPIFLRYPKKSEKTSLYILKELIENGYSKNPESWEVSYPKAECAEIKKAVNHRVLIFSAGTMTEIMEEIRKEIPAECVIVKATSIKPFDYDTINDVFSENGDCFLVTAEEGNIIGGFGQQLTNYIMKKYKNRILDFENIGIGDKFIPFGENDELFETAGLSKTEITNKIKKLIGV